MAERKLLIDEESMEYKGLFNLKELYSIIDDYIKVKGYDKFEPLNREDIHQEGKDIHIILELKKWHTDYIRKFLKLEIFFTDIKEAETEVDGHKMRLNKGELEFLFTGYLETDWEGRWEGRPMYHFLRTIFDRYIYRTHTQHFEMEVISDLTELREKLGSYLNLYRFRQAG